MKEVFLEKLKIAIEKSSIKEQRLIVYYDLLYKT